MTTMTKPKSSAKAAPKSESQPEPTTPPTIFNEAAKAEQFNEELSQKASKLINECSKVKVRISWFTTSAKVDAATMQGMLKDTNAQKGAVAISKRLMSSKSTALKAVKDAKQAIKDHVSAWTVPYLALQEASVDAAGDTEFRKDAGTKLIQKKDIEKFDERLQYLKGLLYASADKLDLVLPEILQAEQEKLGTLFNANDYPRSVRELIGVDVSYEPTGIDADWQKLCPAVYAREAKAARVKFEQVVENAAVEWSRSFVGYVQMVVDQLGNRKRVRPIPEFAKYHDAEIVETMTSETDDGIPKGSIAVNLRMGKAEGQTGKSPTEWLTLTKEDFQTKLRPYECTNERKKIFGSTVDNLKAEMQKFLNVGAMLGPYEAIVKESVAKVQNMLGMASSSLDSEAIAKQLRDSEFFRTQMTNVMADVKIVIQSKIEVGARSRRSINKKLIGALDD